jgi:hypothetical protein
MLACGKKDRDLFIRRSNKEQDVLFVAAMCDCAEMGQI